MQKRVAAIHDISCFGKCSLTVALPLISAAGIEVAVIPTAILSTHTGGFSGYTFRDLSDDIMPISRHWRQSGVEVDAIYSGYLGSKRQVELVIEAAEILKNKQTLMIVDPVMADNGVLYGGFPPDFPKEMVKLCKKADIITPNITEAAMLLGVPFMEAPHTKEYIENLISGLYELTNAKIVLTGVCFDKSKMGAAVLDGGEIEYVFSERIDAMYHGTGDVFASALTAALVRGKSLEAATRIAVDFTCLAISHTLKNHPDMHYSVAFEEILLFLMKALEKSDE